MYTEVTVQRWALKLGISEAKFPEFWEEERIVVTTHASKKDLRDYLMLDLYEVHP